MRKHPKDFKDGVDLVTIDELVAMGMPREMIEILELYIEANAEEESVTFKDCDEGEEGK